MSRPDQVTRENAPCKNCTDHHEACWGKCEKYKSWKSRIDDVSKRRKEYRKKSFADYKHRIY